jgi:hypothetical protein
VKESLRDLWQLGALDRAWQDLRFAVPATRRASCRRGGRCASIRSLHYGMNEGG